MHLDTRKYFFELLLILRLLVAIMRFMTEEIDYRSDRMDSPEGLEIALSRLERWKESIPSDVYENVAEAVGELEYGGYYEAAFYEDPESGDITCDQGISAVDEAGLVGFWIAWHRGGGFAALEASGWNRATIYRKVKNFRDHFGTHPDTYSFDWIKLDLKKLWTAQLMKPVNIVNQAAENKVGKKSASPSTSTTRNSSKRD